MILAGEWALTSDCELNAADWMRVEVPDDNLTVTFVRQSALEDHPAEVATSVMMDLLSQSPPLPGHRAVA